MARSSDAPDIRDAAEALREMVRDVLAPLEEAHPEADLRTATIVLQAAIPLIFKKFSYIPRNPFRPTRAARRRMRQH
jgi:hypothetical protein